MKNRKQFFIIGAQRAGTTYLYNALNEHEQIQMATPLRPEPKHFISQDFTLGRDHYEMTFYNGPSSVYGEKSTCYYEIPDAPARIHSLYPDAKIILIVRDPIERALSNYRFSMVNGLETRSFDDVFLKDTPAPEFNSSAISVNPFSYKQRGIYLPYINNFLKIFPKSAFHVTVFERLVTGADELTKILNFLEVDNNFTPTRQFVNTNQTNLDIQPCEEILEKLDAHFHEHNNSLRDFLGDPLTEWERA